MIYYTYLPVSTYRESYSEMGCIAGRMRRDLATICAKGWCGQWCDDREWMQRCKCEDTIVIVICIIIKDSAGVEHESILREWETENNNKSSAIECAGGWVDE